MSPTCQEWVSIYIVSFPQHTMYRYFRGFGSIENQRQSLMLHYGDNWMRSCSTHLTLFKSYWLFAISVCFNVFHSFFLFVYFCFITLQLVVSILLCIVRPREINLTSYYYIVMPLGRFTLTFPSFGFFIAFPSATFLLLQQGRELVSHRHRVQPIRGDHLLPVQTAFLYCRKNVKLDLCVTYSVLWLERSDTQKILLGVFVSP